MIAHSVTRFGAIVRESVVLVCAFFSLTASGYRSLPIVFNTNKGQVFWVLFIRNFKQVGLQAIPFICIISAVLGFFVIGRAFLFSPIVSNYADYYSDFFIIVVMREVGPLVCGILLIARSGVAITSEIGYVKLNNEFEALASVGVDPRHVFLLPVFFAFPFSLLVMFISFFTSCLLASNIAIAVFGDANVTMADYFLLILSKLNVLELTIMCCKALLGGLVIGLTAIHFGSLVGTRFTDITRALQRATSYQVVVYLVINVALSSLGYF